MSAIDSLTGNNTGKDINELRTEIADFIHVSMCVDGFVKFDSFNNIIRHGKKLNGMLFEVTDKKRGTFFIAWYYN